MSHYQNSTAGFGAKLREKQCLPDPCSHPMGFTAKLGPAFSDQTGEPPSIGFTATLREKPAPFVHPQLSFDFNAPLLERTSPNAVLTHNRAPDAKPPQKHFS